MEDLKKENTAFKNYITNTGLSLQAFSMKLEIQNSQIAKLVKDVNANFTMNFAKRLYKVTKRVYGHGFKLTETIGLYED